MISSSITVRKRRIDSSLTLEERVSEDKNIEYKVISHFEIVQINPSKTILNSYQVPC